MSHSIHDRRSDGLPVRIDGQGYVIDAGGVQRIPIAAQRQLVDDGEEPGDRTINGQGSWKRTMWSFDHGAGQVWWDEDEEADRRQFRTSIGVDPWTRRELTLLPETTQVDADAMARIIALDDGILAVTAAGGLVTDTDPWSTWSAPVGTTAVDVAFDGVAYYVARTTGIDRTVLATGVTTAGWSSAAADRLLISGERLLAVVGGDLAEIAGDGVATAFDQSAAGRAFVGVVEMGGQTFSWDRPVIDDVADLNRRSMLYRHDVNEDSSALLPGDAVLELPPGEHIIAAYGFANVIVLGTNKGIRLAQPTSGGDLAHGGLIALENPDGWDSQVVDLTGDGQYVWFTWTNLAVGKSGLGRLDLDEFIEVGVPAYATDIYAEVVYEEGTTRVTACATVNGRLVFGGSFGAYVQAETYLESGELSSGWINFGSPERKAILGLGLRSLPLPAGSEIRASVAVDKGIEDEYGLVSLQGRRAILANGSIGEPGIVAAGEEMEVRIRILRGEDGSAPRLRRATLRTLPLPFRAEEIVLPVIIQHRVSDGKSEFDQDPNDLLDRLRALYRSRRVVRVDIGDEALMGYIDGVSVERDNSITKIRGWSKTRSSLVGVYAITVITTDIPVHEHYRLSDSEIEGTT